MRRWIWVFCTFCLLQIPEAGYAITPDQAAKIHKIAVISAIGDKFTVLDFEPFGGTRFAVDISDWGIDARAARDVHAALGNRFDVIDGVASPESFGLPSDKIFAALKLSGALQNVDVALIISKGDEVGGVRMPGIGVMQMGRRSRVYANYWVELFDVQAGRSLGRCLGVLPGGLFPCDWNTLKNIDLNIGPSVEKHELSEDEKRVLRSTEEDIIDRSLAFTLGHLGLTPRQ